MNKLHKSIFAFAAIAALNATAPAAAASLVGDTVSCSQTGSGSSFTCSPSTVTIRRATSSSSTAVVGSGTEFSAGGGTFMTFDFGANDLLINMLNTGSLGATIIEFSNLSNAFTSYSFGGSTIGGFDASDVSLTNGVLRLNFIGTNFNAGDTANLSVSAAAAVPEPSTWLMMLFGFGLVGYGMRSAKRRSDEKFETKIKNITYGVA